MTPQHLAIIMDGNGRWAEKRGYPRSIGHVKGTRIAKKIISDCCDLGVKSLVLYAFSSENWMRPEQEVALLMKILDRYLKRETSNFIKKNIRFSCIGELHKLPLNILNLINKAVEKTQSCTGLHLIFALSYSSQSEITEACRALSEKVQSGLLAPSSITSDLIAEHLLTPRGCNPDLVIRTSGELRLSNFLLWQLAYSELYFTETLWPDFTKKDLLLAFASYEKRSRRFGKVSSPSNPSTLWTS
jgi:undecaprenyl diphosphate synthase